MIEESMVDMKLDELVPDFSQPPHPKGIVLKGKTVRLEPLEASLHGASLFAANAVDEGGRNWVYLPYGPFDNVDQYSEWLRSQQDLNDPCFFAIVRLSDSRAVGVASYLRIKPADGSIEVGHINYSPLLQQTLEGTEAMYLMMRWAFENGYRRYEWKCNALNRRSRQAAQRLGLSYEGVFRQATMSKGRNRNTAWFAAIDSEWDALQTCFATYMASENTGKDGRPSKSLSELTRPLLYKIDTLDFA